MQAELEELDVYVPLERLAPVYPGLESELEALIADAQSAVDRHRADVAGLPKAVRKAENDVKRLSSLQADKQARRERLEAKMTPIWIDPPRARRPTDNRPPQPAMSDNLDDLSPAQQDEYRQLVWDLENEIKFALADALRIVDARQSELETKQQKLAKAEHWLESVTRNGRLYLARCLRSLEADAHFEQAQREVAVTTEALASTSMDYPHLVMSAAKRLLKETEK